MTGNLKLARRMDALKPSPTLALDAHIKKMRAAGMDVISFGVGEPDFDTPAAIKEAGKRAIDEGFTKYTPAAGTESLKKAIAGAAGRDYGIDVKPGEIVVSNGAKHSLFNIALALFEKGNEVIIPAPYWVSYPEQIALAGATPVFVPTDMKNDFKMTPKKLRAAMTPKTRALLLNSPSNPTGMVYSRAELEALLKVVAAHNIYLIVDEIYDVLVYTGPYTSVLSLIKDRPGIRERTIVVNGVSKTYAMTGWRIGWTISSERIAKAMADIQSQTTSNPCSISQRAAEAALLGPKTEVTRMAKEFVKRKDLIVKLLGTIPGVKVKSPEGSFYVFPDFSAFVGRTTGGIRIQNTLKLCEYLLEEARVGIVPGEAFGAPGYVRFSFATSQDNIRKGLKNIAAALAKLR